MRKGSWADEATSDQDAPAPKIPAPGLIEKQQHLAQGGVAVTMEYSAAMPDANLEVVGRTLEAVGREDWAAVVAELDPSVEMEDRDIPDADEYRGHDGFLTWLERWGAGWESWRIEDVELRPAGEDVVVALFRMVATGKGSGIEMERADAVVYVLRHGKIVKVVYYNDQSEALEASGSVR